MHAGCGGQSFKAKPRCVILFYLEAFHLFQAWAPLLVLIFLQVCLVCENVHNVYYVWNLAERTQASLDAQAAQEQSQLPTMLGSCGLGEEGLLDATAHFLCLIFQSGIADVTFC